MNRFEFENFALLESESVVTQTKYIRLYDGSEKVNKRILLDEYTVSILITFVLTVLQSKFDNGDVLLTSHRFFWGRHEDIQSGRTSICLHLKYILSLDEEVTGSFFSGRKQKIILHLKPIADSKKPGPIDHSSAHLIKLSSANGLNGEFVKSLREVISARIWEADVSAAASVSSQAAAGGRRTELRAGIVGIERRIQERQKETDQNINIAFEDLTKLMAMAKDMVAVSKSISSKMMERQGEISADETVRFKSYLLGMGIDDPVTRDGYQSNVEYYTSLSQQICQMLLDPITEAGGMIAVADAYCRVNRSRGLELLSPEDMLNACQQMSGPIKLRRFPTGTMVLQLESHDDNIVAKEVAQLVRKHQSMSYEELARHMSISIVLAQARLLAAEQLATICRDESIEGLRFFPNMFLEKA